MSSFSHIVLPTAMTATKVAPNSDNGTTAGRSLWVLAHNFSLIEGLLASEWAANILQHGWAPRSAILVSDMTLSTGNRRSDLVGFAPRNR
jgi:hypothetical protein